MIHTTKEWAALLLAGAAGLAQADTNANLFMQYGVTITDWNPVDDDHNPDNGPFYPEPVVNGLGGYAVNLQWPGHDVNGFREEQHGVPLIEPGYGFVAGTAVIGGYAASSISFPSTASGSAQTFGTAVSTWTLLPGVTLTLAGDLAGRAFLEDENTRGAYSLRLATWEDDQVDTLYALDGTWDTVGPGEFADTFSFSFTNGTSRPVSRNFSITSRLSGDARLVTPVPEPGTFAQLLAGLATLGLLGHWRRRARHRAR